MFNITEENESKYLVNPDPSNLFFYHITNNNNRFTVYAKREGEKEKRYIAKVRPKMMYQLKDIVADVHKSITGAPLCIDCKGICLRFSIPSQRDLEHVIIDFRDNSTFFKILNLKTPMESVICLDSNCNSNMSKVFSCRPDKVCDIKFLKKFQSNPLLNKINDSN